ncbi:hypothetical protein N665_0061s0019 [Sinapis alba]|nr:hypothetical protein N665_0061s0019 [Sinapis alba]
MEFKFLDAIRAHKPDWRVQVKGTKIQASCKKMYFDQLTNKVPVGMWRNIEKFSLTPAGGSYRATKHRYKMNFIHTTEITLVDFKSIQSGKVETNFLIDVIGQVSELGNLETVQCSGKERKKIVFALINLDGRRISCYEVQISNSFDASQLFFNPPIMEAEAFLKRADNFNALTLVESQQEKLEREIRHDKWMHKPHKDIGELLQSSQIGQCRIIATICAIEKDWGWYYFGCKDCKKSVYKIETNVQRVNGNEITTHLWWCEKCKAHIFKVLPKFKIRVLVKDDTGEASLLILGWTADEIISMTIEDLLNGSLDELQDIESFPEAVTTLKDNVTSKGGIYKVEKVWQDLSMLLTGGSTNSWTQSDVGTTNLSGSEVWVHFLMLETEANEDTVITPSSKRKTTSTECAPDITSTSKKQCTKDL